MTCEEAKQSFMDLLYDEIDGFLRQALQEHLAQCSSCRENFETLQATNTLLQKMPEKEPESRLVFAAPQSRSLAAWWHQFSELLPGSFLGRLVMGTVAMVVVFLVAGSLANLHISYERGRLEIGMHLMRPHSIELTEAEKTALLKQLRDQTTEYVARLHAAERVEQAEHLNQMLSAFARDLQHLQQQHENDVMLIGQSLDELHRVANYQFGETSQVLQRLVQFIGQER